MNIIFNIWQQFWKFSTTLLTILNNETEYISKIVRHDFFFDYLSKLFNFYDFFYTEDLLRNFERRKWFIIFLKFNKPITVILSKEPILPDSEKYVLFCIPFVKFRIGKIKLGIYNTGIIIIIIIIQKNTFIYTTP